MPANDDTITLFVVRGWRGICFCHGGVYRARASMLLLQSTPEAKVEETRPNKHIYRWLRLRHGAFYHSTQVSMQE